MFTRSPMRVGAGIWAMSYAVMALARRGTGTTSRGFGRAPPTRSTTAARWAGVVPQQPPTTLTPSSVTNASWASASSSGVSG